MLKTRSQSASKASMSSRAATAAAASFGGGVGFKKTRPTQPIIQDNRKTELCINYEKGSCKYGDRCAFAHGREELRFRTLREMENAGRIPDANKYRCVPCMTWVSTGSCPYHPRCVFIHDPRVEGPEEAWLYVSNSFSGGAAAAASASASANANAAAAANVCPSSPASFFFPDIVRDIDSTEIPTHHARYDIDALTDGMSNAGLRETHRVWYSFLLTLRDTAIFSRHVSNVNMPAHITSSESGIASAHLRRCPTGGLGGTVNPSSASCHPTGTTTASAWAAYGTPSYAAVTAVSTSGAKATGVASGAFSYACPRVSTGGDASGGGPVRSSRASENLLPRPSGISLTTSSHDDFEHLPVFERLRRGIPARSVTPSSPMARGSDDFPGGSTESASPFVTTPTSSFWSSPALPPTKTPSVVNNNSRSSETSIFSGSSCTSGTSDDTHPFFSRMSTSVREKHIARPDDLATPAPIRHPPAVWTSPTPPAPEAGRCWISGDGDTHQQPYHHQAQAGNVGQGWRPLGDSGRGLYPAVSISSSRSDYLSSSLKRVFLCPAANEEAAARSVYSSRFSVVHHSLEQQELHHYPRYQQ